MEQRRHDDYPKAMGTYGWPRQEVCADCQTPCVEIDGDLAKHERSCDWATARRGRLALEARYPNLADVLPDGITPDMLGGAYEHGQGFKRLQKRLPTAGFEFYMINEMVMSDTIAAILERLSEAVKA